MCVCVCVFFFLAAPEDCRCAGGLVRQRLHFLCVSHLQEETFLDAVKDAVGEINLSKKKVTLKKGIEELQQYIIYKFRENSIKYFDSWCIIAVIEFCNCF